MRTRLCDLIDHQFDTILDEWTNLAGQLHAEAARTLPAPALRDHIPELLKSLAQWLRKGEPTKAAEFDTSAIQHALERLSDDIDLRVVVDEYRLLRSIVQRRVITAALDDMADTVRFNEALDEAIGIAVSHYANRREAEIRNEATRLRLTLDVSRLGSWDWRPLVDELQADERMRALFGFPSDLVLRLDDVLRVIHPADRPLLDETAQALTQRDEYEIEYRIIVGDQEKWLRSNGSVVARDAAGRAARVIGTVADITPIKRAEIRERMSKRELAAFARIGEAMSAAQNFDDFLAQLLGLFMQSSPDVDTATILLREDDPDRPEGRLRVKASIGLEDETRRAYTLPIGRGFAGTIAASRQPLLLHDAARSALVMSEWVRKRGIRAFYGVPLISSGELVGVAHIGSRIASDFPDEEKRLFAAMAERAANAIAQASLREQLAKRHAQLETIINALPDALVVSDLETVVIANPAAERLLALEAKDAVGRPLADVLLRTLPRNPDTGEAIPLARLPLCRALRGETPVEQLVVRHVADDRDLHFHVAAAPVVVADAITGAVAIWTDITNLVELEQQRETFMHAVVHDLRNPLNAMIMGTHLVLQKIASTHKDPWVIDRLQRVATNAQRLDRLLRDLLDVALAKSGRIEIHKAAVPIANVLEEQATVWRASSTQHHVHVQPCDAAVLADRDRVVQVLDNLLSNAIKYSPGGGDIDVSCEIEDGQARIAVRDHGLGVAPEDQARIFNPYSRSTRQAWVSGHGLGLFVSAEIVRLHGGRMGVRSEPGKGSEFWFTLPLAEPPPEAQAVH